MTHNKAVLIHILFLFITLFLGNLVSFLLFNNLTTFYHDNLDGLVFENKMLPAERFEFKSSTLM